MGTDPPVVIFALRMCFQVKCFNLTKQDTHYFENGESGNSELTLATPKMPSS